MKKFMIRISSMLVMVALASLVIGFNSCKDDDDDDPPVVILDGYYVKGDATAAADFNDKAIMKMAKNEIGQADRAELMELYIAMKAGAPGFNIVMVAGDVQTTFGPGSDFAVVPEAERITDEPKVDFWRGSYIETNTAFTVPADGLYHVVIDTEYKKVVIAPVVWGVIGAATPLGWGGSTPMPATGFDLNAITFEETDVVLTKADFKFRYSDGWKIVLDTTNDNGALDPGVRVNTNFGGAVDALVAGGDNISNTVPGKYTIQMMWSLTGGTTAAVTKTADLELIDYSATELGLIGDGLMVGGVQHDWESTIMLSVPTIENETDYLWTYETVEVTTLGSFKIREGQDWDHKSIGFGDVTMAGISADKFEGNGDGNFVPLEDGTYDFELKINAVTETYTLTVNPAGAAPELFAVGDGCAAGWDAALALPFSGSNGVYTLTTNLNGTGTYIKFLTTLGQWAPMYGTDGDGTSTGGNLVYRPTEDDPDPASIPCPETAGTYTVTVNTNDMTYTIAAK